MADPKPTQVRVVRDRALMLESGFQGVRFSAELLPLGGDRFMGNSQPLVGYVVRFVERNQERTIEIESLLGALPLAVRQVTDD